MKSKRILGLQKYMDYPGLTFGMIIIFGTHIALRSGIAVNPYPTAPLKCVVIPQFADEDAWARRLTPELAKACAGTSGLLQAPHPPLPELQVWMIGRWLGKPVGPPRAFAGRGIWRWHPETGRRGCGFRRSALSQRHVEHPAGPATAAPCVDQEVQTELLICQLLASVACRWEACPKIIIIPNTYMLLFGTRKKRKTKLTARGKTIQNTF